MGVQAYDDLTRDMLCQFLDSSAGCQDRQSMAESKGPGYRHDRSEARR
jgi:hypothetical protein